eukprot:1522103-Pleurochrysis_carterae.AAC.1
MLAQLEERGLVENLGEAVGNLVARANEVRLDRAVEMALADQTSVLRPGYSRAPLVLIRRISVILRV